MKILQIGTGISPVESDGTRSPEKTIYYLSHYLKDTGCEVKVIDEPSFAHYMVVKDVGDYILKLAVFLPYLFIRLLFEGKKADIIHCHSQFPTVLVLKIRKLLKWKGKVFYTAHNPYLLSDYGIMNWLKHTMFEGFVMKRVDRVIAQTPSVRIKLLHRYAVKPWNMIQVYAGVDLTGINEFLKTHTKKDDGLKRILCVGIINRRKNQMAVVKAVKKVQETVPNCKFIFVGGVEDRAYYVEMQTYIALSKRKNVEFLGEIPHKDLYGYYADADVLVFPTLAETQGVVLIEAMAFGLPVIASDIQVLTDVIQYRVNSALQVEPDSAGIAEGIIRILSDDDLQKKMSRSGRMLVKQKFDWAEIAQEMAEIYKSTLGGDVDKEK